MIKASHAILRLPAEEQQLLKEVRQEAARCWNVILAEEKAYREARDGAWISKGDLQKALKRRFLLHSQTIQALTDRFCANRDTAAANRKLGLATRYPWREKKFLTVPFKQKAIRVTGRGTIQVTLHAGCFLDTGIVPVAPVHTCDIMWRKGRYILSYTAEYQDAEPVEAGLRAGIDIGEIHPVAVCVENGVGLVVSGREVRSLKRRRNKSLGWFSKAFSRCKKGSRRYRKLIRAKGRLKSKTDDQVRDLIHHATRKAIDWCMDHKVSVLVIGDPAGVEKNTRKKKRLSRKARQKVSQMETGRIKDYLQYKAAEAGIASCLKKEHGTSRDCPVCGAQNRVRGRIYRCGACGFIAHRDGKAGFMMLWKKYPGLPLPAAFMIGNIQSVPKYRKRLCMSPACVDGPDVALSSSCHSRTTGRHIAV